VSKDPRRVLVVMGTPAPAGERLVDMLRSRALDVVAVQGESDALRLLAHGSTPSAVLLLNCLYRQPDCRRGCVQQERERLDCVIDCIRSHRGLERVPVMHYALEEQSGLPPEELAALISAAASMSDPVLESGR
jgi:hypothetical protein